MKYLNKNPIDSCELKAISRTMFITLLVTMKCDINCWYCDVLPTSFCEDIPRIDPPAKYVSLEDFENLLNFMEYNSKRPNLSLHFFGGEPTLNPHINEMAKRFKKRFLGKRNIQLLLTTNLNRPSSYWSELDKDIIVAASYHNEKVDEKWFRKARILYEKKQLHHIVFMLTNKNKYNILTAYEKNYNDMPCIICPINQFIDTKEYIEFKKRAITRLGHNPFEDSEKELFYGKGSRKPIHMCSSGLIIDEHGFVHYCWNRMEENEKESVFKNPKQRISMWHTCRNYTDNCDKEVIRSSIDFYNKRIKNNELDKNTYTSEELKKYKSKKILMRCNG